MRVLLIDDHALFRFGVSELLERRGIQVDARGDGEAGLARVLEMAPDAVLLDPVSYTHLRAHETVLDIVCRLLL